MCLRQLMIWHLRTIWGVSIPRLWSPPCLGVLPDLHLVQRASDNTMKVCQKAPPAREGHATGDKTVWQPNLPRTLFCPVRLLQLSLARIKKGPRHESPKGPRLQAPTGLHLTACGLTWSPGIDSQKKKVRPLKNSQENTQKTSASCSHFFVGVFLGVYTFCDA